MFRCIQSCHSGKCNDGIGWSIFLRRFKKAFLVVILHDLRKQPLRFTKPGNLLGVALPLCFLFCSTAIRYTDFPSFFIRFGILLVLSIKRPFGFFKCRSTKGAILARIPTAVLCHPRHAVI